MPKDYDSKNFLQALEEVVQSSIREKFPLGVLYETDRPTFTDNLPQPEGNSLLEKKLFEEYDVLLDDFR